VTNGQTARRKVIEDLENEIVSSFSALEKANVDSIRNLRRQRGDQQITNGAQESTQAKDLAFANGEFNSQVQQTLSGDSGVNC
jgi:hypothetical protein